VDPARGGEESIPPVTPSRAGNIVADDATLVRDGGGRDAPGNAEALIRMLDGER
jgi:hypothetical protein